MIFRLGPPQRAPRSQGRAPGQPPLDGHLRVDRPSPRRRLGRSSTRRRVRLRGGAFSGALRGSAARVFPGVSPRSVSRRYGRRRICAAITSSVVRDRHLARGGARLLMARARAQASTRARGSGHHSATHHSPLAATRQGAHPDSLIPPQIEPRHLPRRFPPPSDSSSVATTASYAHPPCRARRTPIVAAAGDRRRRTRGFAAERLAPSAAAAAAGQRARARARRRRMHRARAREKRRGRARRQGGCCADHQSAGSPVALRCALPTCAESARATDSRRGLAARVAANAARRRLESPASRVALPW